jgi:hypothetical protein
MSSDYIREWLQSMHWNLEGKTGFGMPWEMYYFNDLLWITKGGDINGYSSLFALIPSLKVSIIFLVNGPGLDQVSIQ